MFFFPPIETSWFVTVCLILQSYLPVCNSMLRFVSSDCALLLPRLQLKPCRFLESHNFTCVWISSQQRRTAMISNRYDFALLPHLFDTKQNTSANPITDSTTPPGFRSRKPHGTIQSFVMTPAYFFPLQSIFPSFLNKVSTKSSPSTNRS